MKKTFLILSIFILLCTSLGCAEKTPEYQKGSNIAEETKEATVTVLDSQLQKDDFSWMVTGTAQSNEDVPYAEVKVKYYDDTGALVYSDFTNIVDLAANEPWKFKCYGPSADIKIKEYKIVATTTP